MLEEVYHNYRQLADTIDWKKYDKNELFFNYIKYKDTDPVLAEKFYAGIVCRYWGYTGIVYTKCNRNIPFEECYDILIDAINYLLEKQVWNQPGSSLYQDPKGPEKAFHFVIKRQLAVVLARKTADKRQADFKTLSIDDIHEKYNDASEGLFNLALDLNSTINLYSYIKQQSEALTKIILDTICFSDSRTAELAARALRKLDLASLDYFNYTYDISQEEYTDVLHFIETHTSKQLISEIKKRLYLLRSDWA